MNKHNWHKYEVSPLKMCKLLITAGIYSSSTSRLVAKLYSEGKTEKEIQEITGLKKASINGYLPYQKVIYNQREKSVGADRFGLYRKRKKLIRILQKNNVRGRFLGMHYRASKLSFSYCIWVAI